MIDNVTFEGLEKDFPGEGLKRFQEIASLGGFGTPTLDHTGGIDPAYKGGLDIKGLREVGNKNLAKIEALAGQKKEAKENK